MELILLKDVENVGSKGDVVNVRDGFARNVLIPRKLATASTRSNKQFVEEQRVRSEKRHAKLREEANKKAKELEKIKIQIQAAAGDQDKLFGSVTSEDISAALAENALTIDKKRILIKDPIRTLGEHKVVVELYPQVKTTIIVNVVRKA